MTYGVIRGKCVLRLVSFGMLLGCLCLLAGCFERVETSWSPDGKEIAYFNENGVLRFYNVDTNQTRFIKLAPTPLTAPLWSPDGNALAYYSGTSGTTGIPDTISLRVLDRGSGIVRTLAKQVLPTNDMTLNIKLNINETEEKSEPDAQEDNQGMALFALVFSTPLAWSPDGRQIATIITSEDYARLVIIDYPSGKTRSVLTNKDWLMTVGWSPDGKRLAYLRILLPVKSPSKETSEATELWTYDIEKDSHQKICRMPNDIKEDSLQWSADSQCIGFIMQDPDDHDRAIECIVDAQPDAQIKQVLGALTQVAAWAPGLKGVAFIEEREDQIVVLYKGLEPRTLKVLGRLPEPTPNESPSYSLPQFSPDGKKIAVLVHNGKKPDKVVVMEVE